VCVCVCVRDNETPGELTVNGQTNARRSPVASKQVRAVAEHDALLPGSPHMRCRQKLVVHEASWYSAGSWIACCSVLVLDILYLFISKDEHNFNYLFLSPPSLLSQFSSFFFLHCETILQIEKRIVGLYLSWDDKAASCNPSSSLAFLILNFQNDSSCSLNLWVQHFPVLLIAGGSGIYATTKKGTFLIAWTWILILHFKALNQEAILSSSFKCS